MWYKLSISSLLFCELLLVIMTDKVLKEYRELCGILTEYWITGNFSTVYDEVIFSQFSKIFENVSLFAEGDREGHNC